MRRAGGQVPGNVGQAAPNPGAVTCPHERPCTTGEKWKTTLAWEAAATITQELGLWKVAVVGPGAEVALSPVAGPHQEWGTENPTSEKAQYRSLQP